MLTVPSLPAPPPRPPFSHPLVCLLPRLPPLQGRVRTAGARVPCPPTSRRQLAPRKPLMETLDGEGKRWGRLLAPVGLSVSHERVGCLRHGVRRGRVASTAGQDQLGGGGGSGKRVGAAGGHTHTHAHTYIHRHVQHNTNVAWLLPGGWRTLHRPGGWRMKHAPVCLFFPSLSIWVVETGGGGGRIGRPAPSHPPTLSVAVGAGLTWSS